MERARVGRARARGHPAKREEALDGEEQKGAECQRHKDLDDRVVLHRPYVVLARADRVRCLGGGVQRTELALTDLRPPRAEEHEPHQAVEEPRREDGDGLGAGARPARNLDDWRARDPCRGEVSISVSRGDPPTGGGPMLRTRAAGMPVWHDFAPLPDSSFPHHEQLCRFEDSGGGHLRWARRGR